jgi:uncharacterized protein
MSDSHSHRANIRQAVDIFNERGIARCFHAGDILSPASWEEFKNIRCPIDFVFGNLDLLRKPMIRAFKGKGTFHDTKFKFILGKKRFLMMHEPVALDSIRDINKYDCVIYGHTHRQDIRTEAGILIVNPGEVCGYLTGVSTVVLLEIPSMKVELVTLKESEIVDVFL